MNRKAKFGRRVDKSLVPFSHLLPFPRGNGAVVHAPPLVRNHQIRVYPQNGTEAFATGTSSVRPRKIKQLQRGRFESFPLKFKALAKGLDHTAHHQAGLTIALHPGLFNGLAQTAQTLLIRGYKPVEHQMPMTRIGLGGLGKGLAVQDLLNTKHRGFPPGGPDRL